MKALLRFVLVGACLFAATGMTIRRAPPPKNAVAMSDEEKLLAAAMARDLGGDDIVVQRRLLENARQVALSPTSDTTHLADGDPIIERRLIQQMRLQLESEARRDEPTDAELREYLNDHADRFAVPARVRVEQMFFSSARRGAAVEADARDVLGRLRAPFYADAEKPTGSFRVDVLSDPGMWPTYLPLQSARELEKFFGAAAFDIVTVPAGEWAGPYRSPLGYHLVRLVERLPATLPPFDTVRAAVRLALLNDRAEAHIQRTLQ